MARGCASGAAVSGAVSAAAAVSGIVSAAGAASRAPPVSATGSFGASLIVPSRGYYESFLAPDSRMSALAGERRVRWRVRGVSGAFDLVSRLFEVRVCGFACSWRAVGWRARRARSQSGVEQVA